jgi:hypothetical protein
VSSSPPATPVEWPRTAMSVARPLVTLALVLVAACGTYPSLIPTATVAPDAAGLVLLAGSVAQPLATLVERGNRLVQLEVPDHTDWISANGSGSLLITVQGGDLQRGAVADEHVAWSRIGGDRSGLAHQPARAALSVDGTRAAVLSANLDEPSPFQVGVLDIDTGHLAVTEIREPVDGFPQWFGASRVGIRTNDAQGTRHLRLLDIAAGVVSAGPLPVGDVSVASAANLVVGLRDDSGEFFERGVEDWMTNGDVGLSPLRIVQGGRREFTPRAFGVDPAGRRIAVVWSDADDTLSEIGVYDRSIGWRDPARFPIPQGSERAVVVWLR